MQIRIASLVRFRFEVLPTINLYNQACFKACKIYNVVVNRNLSAETKPVDLPLAQ